MIDEVSAMKRRTKKFTPVLLPDGKMSLTKQKVEFDVGNTRNTFGDYLAHFIKIGACTAFSAFLNPVCFVCVAILVWFLVKDIIRDISRSKMIYYGIERPCLDKRIVEDDEGPDTYQLWFENKQGDYHVAATVEKDYFDGTEVGDEFYLVFFQDETVPCLWYRKSEWELDPISLALHE